MITYAELLAFGDPRAKHPGESLLWTPGPDENWARNRIAVDVGKTKAMGLRVAMAAPRIVVLTHDDHDHIGGWNSYASAGLHALRQLWVPYEWGLLVEAFSGLDLASSANSHEPLSTHNAGSAEEIDNAAEGWDDSRAESIRRSVADGVKNATDLGRSAEAQRRLGELLRELAGDSPRNCECPVGANANEHVPGELSELTEDDDDTRPYWVGTPEQVAGRAIKRAKRILRIFEDALRVGSVIRYFSVDQYASRPNYEAWIRSGRPGLVTIANAIEMKPPGTLRASLQQIAYVSTLTVQNRRALCPVLWDRYRPRVLVWSDSSGEWTVGRPGLSGLMELIDLSTAPHHGSANAAHDPAWHFLSQNRRLEDLKMVLAGGEHTQEHACPDSSVRSDFLKLAPVWQRACTRCRHFSPLPRSATDVIVHLPIPGGASIAAGGCPV